MKRNWKRLLAMLLCAAMVMTMDTQVFAADGTETAVSETDAASENAVSMDEMTQAVTSAAESTEAAASENAAESAEISASEDMISEDMISEDMVSEDMAEAVSADTAEAAGGNEAWVQCGDFYVAGGTKSDDYYFDEGQKKLVVKQSTPLTISGSSTTQNIVLESNADVTISGLSISISGAKSAIETAGTGVKLTLAGKNKLTGGHAGLECSVECGITISGEGSLEAVGGFKGAGIGGDLKKAGGSIIINGGTITAKGGKAAAGIGGGEGGAGGSIIINGGTISAAGGNNQNGGGGAGIGGGSGGAGGIISITNGTISANGGESSAVTSGGAGIGGGYNGAGGIISITNGTISAAGGADGAGIGGGSGGAGGIIGINGGTISANGGNGQNGGGAGIGGGYNGAGGSISITNGIISANGGENGSCLSGGAGIGGGYNGAGGSISITNGTINAAGGESGAGIGGGYNRAGGTISINGGTISAAGGNNQNGGGAGIGGGYNGAGESISITNGIISANGGQYGAGIGGGFLGKSGSISINGGLVSANGGANGAGIGGGFQGAGESISITNGTINANGGQYGAGIGGGNVGEGGSISINGGRVSANGGQYGAGIGGGTSGSGGSISINGGWVSATGGAGGAGIGGGISNAGGSISITNGTINAIGRAGGAGIGGGAAGAGGSISITNGTINAAGGESGAGIGGTGGSISITNGTINAAGGGSGAGIGGGEFYTININGGTISANGGQYKAGIGGDNSTVTINDGIISATGGEQGAGIGGANSTVTINDGKIIAAGGEQGAGIGGGTSGSGGSISINGGIISAAGGKRGAGIGGGYNLPGCTVTITGGQVHAADGGSKTGGIAEDIGHGEKQDSGSSLESGTCTISNAIVTKGTETEVSGNAELLESIDYATGFTVDCGAVFTVPEGKKVTVNGKFTNNGTISGKGTITGSGTFTTMTLGSGKKYISASDTLYTGSALTPAVTVSEDILGKSFTVSSSAYSHNYTYINEKGERTSELIDFGSYTVVVSGNAGEQVDTAKFHVNSTWQGDYTYTISGNDIVCTLYNNNASENVSVPATAVISGNTYKTVLSGNVFQNKVGLSCISVDDGVKTGNSCVNMFNNCNALKKLDLRGLDTSAATDMSHMFIMCKSLTDLDLSSFDTSKVTDMSFMFGMCSKLTDLDLSSFDTSKVTDMKEMFHFCYMLKSLDMSKFKTSAVTDMNNMFSECQALSSLDLSSLDTSNVLNMTGIFTDCNGIKKLNTPKRSGGATAALPTTMYDKDVTEYNYLPKNVSSSVTLYLRYSVLFKDTKDQPVSSGYVLDSNVIKVPAAPAGYYYTVYTTSACDAVYDLNKSVSGNMTLYVKPSPVTYTITYDIAGGTNAAANPAAYTIETADIALAAPTRQGYIFKGWTGSNGTAPQTAVTIARGSYGNKSYTANWIAEALPLAANMKDAVISAIPDQTYTGLKLTPEPVITLNGLTLAKDRDYTCVYSNNVKAGEATLKVTGMNEVSGTKSVTFKIVPRTINGTDKNVHIAVGSVVFTKTKEYRPAVTVYVDGKKISSGLYTTGYTDNTAPGTGKVTVTFNEKAKNLSGSASAEFRILEAADKGKMIKKAKLADTGTALVYTGSEIRPAVEVYAAEGGSPLTLSTDYTVDYINNVQAGTATAIITGIGSYAGTKSVKFRIKKISIKNANADVTVADKEYYSTGYAIQPDVTVSLNGVKLENGIDYKVKYSSNVKAGRAKCTIYGTGSYSGKLGQAYFAIGMYDWEAISANIASQTYTGKALKPEPEFKYEGKVVRLKRGKAYSMSYRRNKNTGTATAYVKGAGSYSGGTKKTVKFEIK